MGTHDHGPKINPVLVQNDNTDFSNFLEISKFLVFFWKNLIKNVIAYIFQSISSITSIIMNVEFSSQSELKLCICLGVQENGLSAENLEKIICELGQECANIACKVSSSSALN